MKKNLFLILIIIFNIFPSSFNSHGQIGYINIPSAYTAPESNLAFIANRNEPDRKIMLFASPFDWLDANLFYVDITGMPYGSGYKQSNKDKGFSFKVYLNEFLGHKIAFGANDIAGTGYFSSEYFVFSNRINKFEYSFGMGWGNYSDGVKIDNPFIQIDDSFRERSKVIKDKGGSPDSNNYFSGEKASLFFGSSYQLDRNNNFFIEYDPTKLDRIDYPKRKTKINFGYERKFTNALLKVSYIRGTEFNIQLSSNFDYRDFRSTNEPVIESDINRYSELRRILSLNNIGLKEIRENNEKLAIVVRQNSYQNQYYVNDIVRKNAEYFLEDKEEVIISQYIHGMNMTESSFVANAPSNIKNENYTSSNDLEKIYATEDYFPYLRSNFSPRIKNFIASREKFYFGGIFIENDLEVIFSENFFLLSNLKYSLVDNFDGLYIPPVDTYPNQVRSDLKEYLNEMSSGISIGRLELNYFKSLNKKHFFRASAGLFEDMFGGYGLDYVYYPEGSLISYGAELYHLRKRDYSLNFDFKDYENSIFRVSAQLVEPNTKINFRLSAGEYIAGDEGYTFEIARRMDNGIEFSAFFSKTDVSPELFGEGSFDKGIRIRVPFNIFNGKKSMSTFEWHPLTKDPAALLRKSINLHSETQRYRIY